MFKKRPLKLNSNKNSNIFVATSNQLYNKEKIFFYCRKHASKSAGLPHQSSSSDYKKKSYDFTDYAYREAVGKLKIMLAESYAPQKYSSSSSIFKSVTDDDTDTDQQTIVERPAFKEISKYFPYKPYTSYSTTPSYMHKPLSSLQAPPTGMLMGGPYIT